MNPADHYAEAERLLAGGGENPMVDLVKAGVHATLATVDRAVSRQAEVDAKRAMCTCAHIPDIPAAVTHVDPDCPIHGGS